MHAHSRIAFQSRRSRLLVTWRFGKLPAMAAATSSIEPFLVANTTRIWLKAYTSYHKMIGLPAKRGVRPNVTSVVMTLVSAISMTGDSERIGRGAARTRGDWAARPRARRSGSAGTRPHPGAARRHGRRRTGL